MRRGTRNVVHKTTDGQGLLRTLSTALCVPFMMLECQADDEEERREGNRMN